MIISSATDIRNYLDDVRPDVRGCAGAEGVACAVEALRAADHPAWGSDWSEWLGTDEVQDLITDGATEAPAP